MKITDEFTVSVPVERAWEVLTGLAGIAPCMPGAQLTAFDGETYNGKVRIKVGPVISEFAGTARFAEKDDVAHRAVIDACGKDSRGAGNQLVADSVMSSAAETAAPASAAPASSAASAPAAASGPAAPHASRLTEPEQEPAVLDLMQLAGGSIAKRLVPLLLGLIVVAVIIYLLVR
jgi:carbon monoxide dehydrogenase subunit G